MPKIPTYDQPQVTPNAAPTPQFQAPNPEQFMTGQRQVAGLQQASSQTMQAVSAVGAEMNQRYTVQKLTDSEAQLTEALTAYSTEARQKLGENAKGLTKDSQAFWDDANKKIAEGLDDDTQRAAFSRIAARRKPAFAAGIAGHEFEQGKVAANAAGESSINVSISAAAAAAMGGITPQSQLDIANNKDSALRTLEATLTANGMQAALPEKRLALTTKLHSEIIQSLIPTDPDAAKGWYYSNKKEIDGTKQAEIEKILETSGGLVTAQKVATELRSSGKSFDEMMSYVETTYSGKQQELIKHELKNRAHEDEIGKKLQEQQALAPSQKILAEAATRGSWISSATRQAELNRLVSHPDLQQQVAQEFARHNEHMQNLQDAANSRARANSERMLPNDSQVANWYQLKTEPEALRAIDLTQLRNNKSISEKQFNDLVGDQQSLRKGGLHEDTILADKAAVDLVLKGAKIETSGKSADPAMLGKFYDRFNAMVKMEGKDVPQARKVEIARSLLNQVAVERDYWFGTKEKPAFEVTAADRIRAKKVTVPALDRQQITEALRRRNLPVTEETIKQLYIKKLGN